MTLNGGYLRIPRGLICSWQDGHEYSSHEARVDLIALAAFKAHTNRHGVELEVGQFAASYSILAARWNWHRERVRRFIGRLVSSHFLATPLPTPLATPLGHIYTIAEYGTYSGKRATTDTPTDTPTDTNQRKKGLERRNRRSPVVPFEGSAFSKAWADFREHRKQIRAPMTPLAEERMLAKLGKLEEGVAVEALASSIENGWKGVFPDKVKRRPLVPQTKDYDESDGSPVIDFETRRTT